MSPYVQKSCSRVASTDMRLTISPEARPCSSLARTIDFVKISVTRPARARILKRHNEQHECTIWEPLTRSQRHVESTLRMNRSSQPMKSMNGDYTDLVDANGLDNRRYKHDHGNGKALQFTWSLVVRLKSSILVPWDITQKPAKKLRLKKSEKILDDFKTSCDSIGTTISNEKCSPQRAAYILWDVFKRQ